MLGVAVVLFADATMAVVSPAAVSPHPILLWDAIYIPVVALVILGFMDRPGKTRSVAEWFVHLAWDLCVLSIGAAPALFDSTEAKRRLGTWPQLHIVVLFELVAVGVGGTVLARFKAAPYKNGLEAIAALAISGTLLGFLTYLGWNG
jgi:hypothetical protein